MHDSEVDRGCPHTCSSAPAHPMLSNPCHTYTHSAGPGRPQGSPAAAPAAAAGAKGSEAGGSKRPRDEIEEIMFIDKYKKKARQDAAAAACKAASSRPLVDARMERKLFMSSKVGGRRCTMGGCCEPGMAFKEASLDQSACV